MSEKTKIKKKSKIIPMILGLIPGFIAGFSLALLINWALGDISTALYFCVLFMYIAIGILAVFIGIAIHEAGHLVFGITTGYKFSSYRIFSLMLLKDKNNKIKLKRFKIAGTGGQCLMAPPDMLDGKIPSVMYNLGGVFANIIFGILFLILFFLLLDIKLVAIIMMIFCIINFTFAMTNGIPMSSGGIDNDAKNAISIKKNSAAMRAFWIQMKINEETAKGVILNDMPDEWFTLPTEEEMQSPIISALTVFSANRLLYQKRFKEAELLIKNIIDEDNAVITFYKRILTCDRIYIELIGECKNETVESMLTTEQKALMKAMKNYPSVIRTEYAYELLIKKDYNKADKLLNHFKKIAKTYPYKNEIEVELELINIAKSKQK